MRAPRPRKVSIYVFSWELLFPRFQAPRPPPKQASKTSALARERQREKRQADMSVRIDISRLAVAPPARHIWEASVRVGRGMFPQTMGTRIPLQGRKKRQASSRDHPQAFGNTRQTGLQWASSSGKISRNIRKVPHCARTMRQHPPGVDCLHVVRDFSGLVCRNSMRRFYTVYAICAHVETAATWTRNCG